jgi:hypothetical protein
MQAKLKGCLSSERETSNKQEHGEFSYHFLSTSLTVRLVGIEELTTADQKGFRYTPVDQSTLF